MTGGVAFRITPRGVQNDGVWRFESLCRKFRIVVCVSGYVGHGSYGNYPPT
jgi:hypothetical protein